MGRVELLPILVGSGEGRQDEDLVAREVSVASEFRLVRDVIEELEEAIRDVMMGGSYFSKGITEQISSNPDSDNTILNT